MNSRAATQMMIDTLCPENPPNIREVPPVPVVFIENLAHPEKEIEEYLEFCEHILPLIYKMITDPDFRDTHELVFLPNGQIFLRASCY